MTEYERTVVGALAGIKLLLFYCVAVGTAVILLAIFK
jgi:hypothetical protein